MITQDLLKYIETELAKGTPKNIIESILLSGGGWNLRDISEGFSTLDAKKNGTVATLSPLSMISVNNDANSQKTIQPLVMPAENYQKQIYQSKVPKTKKPHSLFKIVGIIIIICAFIGGGLYYYKYLDLNIISNFAKNSVKLAVNTIRNQNTDKSTATNSSAEQTVSTSSDTTQSATNSYYKNAKFGYQLSFGDKWHIPLKFDALYDLTMQSSNPSVQPSETELQSWKPENARNLVLVKASEEEEQVFYDQLIKGQVAMVFPGDSINVTLTNTSSSFKNIVSTTTATRIITKIIVNDKFDGFMTQSKPGAVINTTSVSVKLVSDDSISDGSTPNMINFSTHNVSFEELLKLVNTLVY